MHVLSPAATGAPIGTPLRAFLGTPHCMFPEQVVGSDKVDARSDIWALGTILFELLVGKTPYRDDTLP